MWLTRMLKSSNLVTFRATEALSVPGNFSWGNRSTLCPWQLLSGQQKHCVCLATFPRAPKALSVPSNNSQGNRSTVCAWQCLSRQQKHCLCPATSLRATKALLGVVIIFFSFTWDQTPGNIPDPPFCKVAHTRLPVLCSPFSRSA